MIGSGQRTGARALQEDHFRIALLPSRPQRPEALLMVLADGMGGQVGGAIAAEMAVDSCVSALQAQASGQLNLRLGLAAANAAISEAIKADVALADMGSTLLVVLLQGDRFTWLSVGDSILWHWRHGRLQRLNADHSMRATLLDLLELGRITPEQYEADPRKSMLNSAVTGEDIRLVDEPGVHHALEPGDVLLLATDGVQTIDEPALAALAQGAQEAQGLVDAVLDAVDAAGRPQQDNTTVMAYLHVAGESVGQRRRQMEAPTVRRASRPSDSASTDSSSTVARRVWR